MPDFGKKFIFLVAFLMLALTLSACGKRAAHVDPPEDVTNDTFPWKYPDPATDPKP